MMGKSEKPAEERSPVTQVAVARQRIFLIQDMEVMLYSL